MLSIIIPSRNERYLNPTIADLLAKSRGEVNIVAVLDGYETERIQDPRVTYLHRKRAGGMRAGINAAIAASTGEFVMKIDAHCMVDEGYDVKLAASCPDSTVVIPRRKRLDAENWRVLATQKPDVDYGYLTFPFNSDGTIKKGGLRGKPWNDLSKLHPYKRHPQAAGLTIDDTMSFQGSCWFMKRSYFHFLDLMDQHNYGSLFYEAQEISLKAWLSGGRVLVNKTTWYAHFHKGRTEGRGYPLGRNQRQIGLDFVLRWLQNESGWKKQTRPFSWLIEHFAPVPSWPSDWKERIPQSTILPA